MANLDLKKTLDILKGARVLVVGDTGFKGSWLSLWLNELGSEVFGYALPPEREEDHFHLLALEKVIHHTDGDIRDFSTFFRYFQDVRPNFVFHLAAQPLVRRSYAEPKLTFDTNIGGSVNVLEAVRQTPDVRVLVYLTSDKCYLNKEWDWSYRENDELGGLDPYSASKAAAEHVFTAYNRSYFQQRENFGAATVRAGNVIGGGDWSPDRIVPDCIRSLRKKDPIVLRNPSSTRPWQHVLEPLNGYLRLAVELAKNPKEFSGAWNFGPRVESIRTVHDLAQGIIDGWGNGTIKIQKEEAAPHEARLLQLNCDKAMQRLGWRPHWDFARTVAETVRWYRDFLERKEIRETSKGQIAAYMEGSHD